MKTSTASSLRGARVLLVEDDTLLLMELESIMLGAGAEAVRACQTIEDASAAAREGPISAAMLDVRIGAESIAPIARELDDRGTPFVFYTGEPSNCAVLMEWPRCKVLAKPARADAILSAVAELVRSKRAA